MKRRLYFLVFVAAVVLTGKGFASGETWCPASIKVEQKAEAPSLQWTLSYDSSPDRLQMVTFFSGPPAEDASLKYDGRSKDKGGVDRHVVPAER